MALYLDVVPGDRIRIGDATVSVEEKSGRRTRLRIDATADVKHHKAGSPSGDPTRKNEPFRLTRPRLQRG